MGQPRLVESLQLPRKSYFVTGNSSLILLHSGDRPETQGAAPPGRNDPAEPHCPQGVSWWMWSRPRSARRRAPPRSAAFAYHAIFPIPCIGQHPPAVDVQVEALVHRVHAERGPIPLAGGVHADHTARASFVRVDWPRANATMTAWLPLELYP